MQWNLSSNPAMILRVKVADIINTKSQGILLLLISNELVSMYDSSNGTIAAILFSFWVILSTLLIYHDSTHGQVLFDVYMYI